MNPCLVRSRRAFLAISALSLSPFAAHAAGPEGGFPDLVGPHRIKRKFTPARSPLGPIPTKARWAFLIDLDTGSVLLEKRSTAAMPPASMTKLMTLFITYQRLQAGRLTLDQELPVSEKAWRTGGSKMFVPYPGRVSVRNLIQGVEVDSGNDACVVLAEGIAGSVAGFVRLMNQTARQLGLVNSHFVNPTGLPVSGHYMCCRDVASLARATIINFPLYYRFAAQKSFTFDKIKQYNSNPLVQNDLADGLKAGFTDGGGYGLCASAKRDARRVIMVLNGMPSLDDRTREAARLLNWSFDKFENVVLFKNDKTVTAIPVSLGNARSVSVTGRSALLATVPRDWRRTARLRVRYSAPARAPITAEQTLAELTLSGRGVPPAHFSLVAKRPVARLGLIDRSFDTIPAMLAPLTKMIRWDEVAWVTSAMVGTGAYYAFRAWFRAKETFR